MGEIFWREAQQMWAKARCQSDEVSQLHGEAVWLSAKPAISATPGATLEIDAAFRKTHQLLTTSR